MLGLWHVNQRNQEEPRRHRRRKTNTNILNKLRVRTFVGILHAHVRNQRYICKRQGNRQNFSHPQHHKKKKRTCVGVTHPPFCPDIKTLGRRWHVIVSCGRWGRRPLSALPSMKRAEFQVALRPDPVAGYGGNHREIGRLASARKCDLAGNDSFQVHCQPDGLEITARRRSTANTRKRKWGALNGSVSVW